MYPPTLPGNINLLRCLCLQIARYSLIRLNKRVTSSPRTSGSPVSSTVALDWIAWVTKFQLIISTVEGKVLTENQNIAIRGRDADWGSLASRSYISSGKERNGGYFRGVNLQPLVDHKSSSRGACPWNTGWNNSTTPHSKFRHLHVREWEMKKKCIYRPFLNEVGKSHGLPHKEGQTTWVLLSVTRCKLGR